MSDFFCFYTFTISTRCTCYLIRVCYTPSWSSCSIRLSISSIWMNPTIFRFNFSRLRTNCIIFISKVIRCTKSYRKTFNEFVRILEFCFSSDCISICILSPVKRTEIYANIEVIIFISSNDSL